MTITFVKGSDHCIKDEKNPSFDTGGQPYKKVTLLYTRTTADVCRVQLSTARYTVKTSTGQTRDVTVAQTSLVGLYQTKCEGGTCRAGTRRSDQDHRACCRVRLTAVWPGAGRA